MSNTVMVSTFGEPIPVTKTTLPNLNSFHRKLEEIWDSKWVTNNGPNLRELERRLAERFSVDQCLVTTNGTISMQLALRSLGVTGSVITTPFSYVATTNVLLYDDLEPIFVDVEPRYFTLDPSLVEAAIRDNTTAILATHVYGYPCLNEELQAIADRHGLKLIYDAAHAFDIEKDGKSILTWGDASTLSFHATKSFHTIEGGAVICKTASDTERVDRLRSFGHVGRDYREMGINGKNSELHAVIGLLNLDLLAENLAARKAISQRYEKQLTGVEVRCLTPDGYENMRYNYSYFPIVCKDESQREAIVNYLNDRNVWPRRYFEPSLNQLPFLKGSISNCPVSEEASRTVLCLPLYPALPLEHVDIIAGMVREATITCQV